MNERLQPRAAAAEARADHRRAPRDRRVTRDRRLATAELVLEIATAASGSLELDAILHAALDRLRAVIPFTGGSIALVDGDELVIRAAIGPFTAEALGQRLPRGAGRSWQVIATGEPHRIDDLQAAGVRMAGPAAAGAMRSWLAVPIVRGEQGIGLLEVDSTAAHAFTDGDTELVATVARALAGPIDLAARHAAERVRRQLRDAFTGVVSHELRTPITTIFGMSQVLRQRHASLDVEARGQLIADIEAEADRLRRLVEDLLILSRVEAGGFQLDREPVAVGHLVRRVVADEARRWPDRSFVADVPDDLPVALGEELYVEQVLRNLLSNAAKYSAPGGGVQVAVEPGEGTIALRVTDDGIGLPDGPLDELFGLYYRAPEATRAAPGAGIGLYVCRQLAEAMGGSITAARRAQGATFTFALPADNGEPASSVDGSSSETAGAIR